MAAVPIPTLISNRREPMEDISDPSLCRASCSGSCSGSGSCYGSGSGSGPGAAVAVAASILPLHDRVSKYLRHLCDGIERNDNDDYKKDWWGVRDGGGAPVVDPILTAEGMRNNDGEKCAIRSLRPDDGYKLRIVAIGIRSISLQH